MAQLDNYEKLRNGQVESVVEQEARSEAENNNNVLWTDRRRVTIFALPWSFTKYSLTRNRLIVQKGFLNLREEEVLLFRVRDISYSQTLGERIGGTGTLKIISTDASVPELELLHIKNARKVKDVLSLVVDQARKKNGVRPAEMIGGRPGMPPQDCPDCGNLPGELL